LRSLRSNQSGASTDVCNERGRAKCETGTGRAGQEGAQASGRLPVQLALAGGLAHNLQHRTHHCVGKSGFPPFGFPIACDVIPFRNRSGPVSIRLCHPRRRIARLQRVVGFARRVRYVLRVRLRSLDSHLAPRLWDRLSRHGECHRNTELVVGCGVSNRSRNALRAARESADFVFKMQPEYASEPIRSPGKR
jgi:hypothetical protein